MRSLRPAEAWLADLGLPAAARQTLLFLIRTVEYGDDLPLIATEGHRAVDVFHITKNGAKLTAPDQDGLAGRLRRLLENRE